jgi:hypothetical protein
MATRFGSQKSLKFGTLFLTGSISLLIAVPALAQEVPGGEALIPYLVLMSAVILIPFYVYWALATQVIARKTNTQNAWLAWIPVANFILWAKIANKPVWWGLLCIVPLVGMVFTVLVWMAIAEARHKPNWWGILTLIPIANFIVPGYLAWSK